MADLTGSRVTVRKTKFDGTLRSEWDGELVEASDAWLVVHHDGERDEKRQDGGIASVPSHALHYFGLAQPVTLLLTFDELARFTGAKCDAALPTTIEGHVVTFVDLDLDVIVTPRLATSVRDQETFARNSRQMRYDAEAQSAALRGIGLALAMVERREAPFDGSAELLLGRLLAARGPL